MLAVVLQRRLLSQLHSVGNLAAAYAHTFWWAFGFIVLAAIPTMLLPGTAPEKTPDQPNGASVEPIAA